MESVDGLGSVHAGPALEARPVDLHLVGAGIGERELLERALFDVGARLDVRVHPDLDDLVAALAEPNGRSALVVLDAGPDPTDAARSLETLRASPTGAALPIVVIAGRDDPDVVVGFYRAGASVVVLRSRFVDVWLRALREVVRFWAGTAVLPTAGAHAVPVAS